MQPSIETRVQYDDAGGTATITLDSPRNRNALSRAMRSGLMQALERAAADDSVRVVVLTHTGTTFCAGMDLKETVAEKPGEEAVRELPGLLRRIAHCPKPIIGRIMGAARGGGVGIVASCDISVVASSATFALPEVRVGLIPSTVSVPVLARMAPTAAREMMLTGAVVSAERARQSGLVATVVDPEDLDATVQDYRQALLAGGPGALAGTKKLLASLIDDSEERYSAMLDISARQFNTAEAREGAQAFAGRRAPGWMAVSQP